MRVMVFAGTNREFREWLSRRIAAWLRDYLKKGVDKQ